MSFLSNTRKSLQPDPKKSTKLPKLTIQEQIENNEVIERMNRKITYTKNQRHLAKTLPFVEALQATGNSTANIFRIEPEQVCFTNFEVGKIYESEVRLINRSKYIQRIKITPFQTKEFVISNVKYPNQDSGDIAPGMQVSIFVRFKPFNLHDNQDELIIIVGDGIAKIPIKAQREKCQGQWPEEINCGHCWVGDQLNKEINIENAGGEAIYTMENSAEFEHILGPFKIYPTELKVEKGKKNSLFIEFQPTKQGLFEEEISFTSNQGNDKKIKIKLKGGAYSAEITLNEINNQKVIHKKFHNILYLNNCEPGKVSSSTFKVHNHAVVPVDYLWSLDRDPNFIISEAKGKISPSELLEFKASYKPLDRSPKSLFAYLYLYNLPKESILSNSETKIINGIEMIECIKLEIKVSTQDSNVEVIPLHKAITEKLFVGKTKRTYFNVVNNSDVDRKFWVTKIKSDEFCESECDFYEERIVLANTSENIWFNFKINKLTKQTQKSYFLIQFDNVPAKMVSIEGRVEYPEIELYSTDIEFELLRVNSCYKKKFKIVNPGENEINFKFDNKHRYYELDFYDFYEFESEEYYKDQLKIKCKEGECIDWISIPPLSEKTVCFELVTRNPQEINFEVELIVENGNTYKIKVSGRVEETEGKISQNFIPIKEIFQGNVYNSSKIFSKEFNIENTGNHSLRYEIIQTEIEECIINLSDLNGIIEPMTSQSIDFVFEPLKTGPFSPVFEINFYDDVPAFSSVSENDDEITEEVPEDRKKLLKTESLKIQGKIRGVETAYYIKDESRAKKVAQKLTDDAHMSVKLSSYSKSSAQRSHYLDNYRIVYPFLEEINFYNCEINKVEQLEIIIENNSELTAEFQVYADNYQSIQKVNFTLSESLPDQKSKIKGSLQTDELAFTSQMGQTYIENRALNQAQKIYLSNNKGISIMCEPNVGILNKHQSQKIVITMFNDASGKFKDELIIVIKDHEIKKFPINIQIIGTPVSLSKNQLGIDFRKEVPLLHAGTFLNNNGKSSRNLKILNNGPREVDLKWSIYPYGNSDPHQDLFKLSFSPAEPGSNNLIQTNWEAIKPQPLLDSPFSINPLYILLEFRNKILKGREEVNFILNIEESSKAEFLQALIIGEPTLLEESGNVVMEDLAIVIQTNIVNPKLKMDQKHENHINKLEKYACNGNENHTKQNDNHRKIKLKNELRCNLSFTIEILTENSKSTHFEIISTSTDSSLQKLKPKTLTSFTKGNNSFNNTNIIDKDFTLPFESYVEIGIELKGNVKNLDEWPLENKVRKDGMLIITFINGEKQCIPLVGWLYRPALQIEMPNSALYTSENCLIDFGVIHVNNHCKKSIYLANPTKSAANWSVVYTKYHQTKNIKFQKELWTDLDYEDENITDEKKCFMLSADSGHILSESIPIHYMPGTLALYNSDDKYADTHKPYKLDFVFKPEKHVLYKSKFVVQVENGPSYEIVLRGRGTFDEEAEIK